MVATLVIHVITYITSHLPTSRGMEGWVGPVGWPIADILPTKWSHANHRSGKVCQPKTNILTTEPCLQPRGFQAISSMGLSALFEHFYTQKIKHSLSFYHIPCLFFILFLCSTPFFLFYVFNWNTELNCNDDDDYIKTRVFEWLIF